jgi:hypothetical protein
MAADPCRAWQRQPDHDPQIAGIGFPAVVIPLATQHYMLLQRNLIYTGIRGASGCSY